MSDMLTREMFEPHLDKTFRVKDGRHVFTLTAIEGRTLSRAEQAAGLRAPFNLIFSGPPGDVLAEGLYALDVEGGPSFDLYVMPIHTPMRGRQDYQSSFN